MKYFKKITGERIYLSPMNLEDAAIYASWLNDPDVSVGLGVYQNLISLNNEQKILEELTTKGHNYAIVTNDHTLIGNIGFKDINHISQTAEIGLFIGDADNRGKGYGGEALRLIVDYGFNTLNLRNIMLKVHSDNEQAIACYKKVGFAEFGRRSESVFVQGRFVDDVLMEIMRV